MSIKKSVQKKIGVMLVKKLVTAIGFFILKSEAGLK